MFYQEFAVSTLPVCGSQPTVILLPPAQLLWLLILYLWRLLFRISAVLALRDSIGERWPFCWVSNLDQKETNLILNHLYSHTLFFFWDFKHIWTSWLRCFLLLLPLCVCELIYFRVIPVQPAPGVLSDMENFSLCWSWISLCGVFTQKSVMSSLS